MAHSSYRSNVTCPVCHRTKATKIGSRVSGLVKCHHCQVCLVVSWSGHYVRDPYGHTSSQVPSRQERSAPQAFQNFSRFSYFSIAIVLGSLLLGGIALSNIAGILPSSLDEWRLKDAAPPVQQSR